MGDEPPTQRAGVVPHARIKSKQMKDLFLMERGAVLGTDENKWTVKEAELGMMPIAQVVQVGRLSWVLFMSAPPVRLDPR